MCTNGHCNVTIYFLFIFYFIYPSYKQILSFRLECSIFNKFLRWWGDKLPTIVFSLGMQLWVTHRAVSWKTRRSSSVRENESVRSEGLIWSIWLIPFFSLCEQLPVILGITSLSISFFTTSRLFDENIYFNSRNSYQITPQCPYISFACYILPSQQLWRFIRRRPSRGNGINSIDGSPCDIPKSASFIL